jgi:hypothetical protein
MMANGKSSSSTFILSFSSTCKCTQYVNNNSSVNFDTGSAWCWC